MNDENTTALTRVLGYLPWGALQAAAPTRNLVGVEGGSFSMAQRENSVATDLGMPFD
jgi:hypothetical protein